MTPLSAPLIYQVHVRPWLHRLSRKQGGKITLDGLPDRTLDSWSQQGVTHIWLMGVWPTGDQARQHAVRLARSGHLPSHAAGDSEEEVCGSPYAVTGYRVSEALGGDEALARFREALNSRGVGLILDFIPNHVALDHPWVKEHPDWFVGSKVRRAEAFRAGSGAGKRWIAHGKDPFFPAWADTAQLDWRLESVHNAMLQELLRVAERCDGIRADMAMLILPHIFEKQWKELPACPGPSATNNFWAPALSLIKTRFPHFLTIAEAYWDLEPTLLEQGFDFAYDKRFYDHLIARRPADLLQHFKNSAPKLWSRGARFLENHDEVRIASLVATEEHRSWAAMLLGLPGLRLCHEGQWEGARERADIRTLRRDFEPVDQSISRVYETLTRSAKSVGDWVREPQILTPEPAWLGNGSHEAFVAWIGLKGHETPFLVAVNLASHVAQCSLRLEGTVGRGVRGWVDVISGQRFLLEFEPEATRTLPLHFAPHQCVWLVPQREA